MVQKCRNGEEIASISGGLKCVLRENLDSDTTTVFNTVMKRLKLIKAATAKGI